MLKKFKASVQILATATLVPIFIQGCATSSVPSERLREVAVITSGSTNIWSMASGGGSVSVVAIDGAAAEKPSGPIELSPGMHQIKMKCGSNFNDVSISVVAGDVYEFAVSVGGGINGCNGALFKVKSGGM